MALGCPHQWFSKPLLIQVTTPVRTPRPHSPHQAWRPPPPPRHVVQSNLAMGTSMVLSGFKGTITESNSWITLDISWYIYSYVMEYCPWDINGMNMGYTLAKLKNSLPWICWKPHEELAGGGGGERRGEHAGERVDERRPHERAGGRADGRTIRLVLFCLVIISTVNLCRIILHLLIQPKNTGTKLLVFETRAILRAGPPPWGRIKGSHEGVAHTHVRTYVRMHARTFMCMYARTFHMHVQK